MKSLRFRPRDWEKQPAGRGKAGSWFGLPIKWPRRELSRSEEAASQRCVCRVSAEELHRRVDAGKLAKDAHRAKPQRQRCRVSAARVSRRARHIAVADGGRANFLRMRPPTSATASSSACSAAMNSSISGRIVWGTCSAIVSATPTPRTIRSPFINGFAKPIADNKPYDQFVRDILTVTGTRKDHPQMDWFRWATTSDNRVEDTAQAFLGLRVSCANCHNHPFENIRQADYWQFAAFFSRIKLVGEAASTKSRSSIRAASSTRAPRNRCPKAFGGPLLRSRKATIRAPTG